MKLSCIYRSFLFHYKCISRKKGSVPKKVHNLRLRVANAFGKKPFSKSCLWLKLRLRESQSIFAEFMDFFGTLPFYLLGLYGT